MTGYIVATAYECEGLIVEEGQTVIFDAAEAHRQAAALSKEYAWISGHGVVIPVEVPCDQDHT